MVALVEPSGFALWLWLLLYEVDLRFNQTMSIVPGVCIIFALLAHMMSRVYLLIEINLVEPYADPGDYRVPSSPAYRPHVAGCLSP